ncbi:MAG: MASE1 domain-containing protein [Nautiliaceae bacterium]
MKYLQIIMLALLYFLSANIRFKSLLSHDIISTIIFPSEGIGLAFILYFGKHLWPGVFIGQFLLALSKSIPFIPAFLTAVISSTEMLLGYYIFKKLKLNPKLENFRDLIILGLIIVFVLQPFNALFSNFIFLKFGIIQKYEFWVSIYSWWFGNVMGELLYTPTVLMFFKYYKKNNILDFLFVGLSFGIISYLTIYLLNIHSALLLLSVTLPVIVIMVYEKNLSYGLFMIVTLSYAIFFAIHNSSGPFIDTIYGINIMDYNLFLLTSLIIVLTVGIFFEKHKEFEIQLQKAIKKALERNKQQQLLMLQQNKHAQMGEMISMIAHQWRQPLNNISLLNQLITKKYFSGTLNEEFIRYFDKNSKKQIELMSKTIDDFRNFFKPGETKEEFELHKVILRIIYMVKDIYAQKGISIEFKDNNIKCKCFGFPNSLSHAVLNIMNNSKDILIEKNISDKKITIELKKMGRKILIIIKDNGGGIDKKVIDKIFDPYFSTKKEKNGTGLGLYMTKIIIKEHMQSDILVNNNKKGAVFTIILNEKICSAINNF